MDARQEQATEKARCDHARIGRGSQHRPTSDSRGDECCRPGTKRTGSSGKCDQSGLNAVASDSDRDRHYCTRDANIKQPAERQKDSSTTYSAPNHPDPIHSVSQILGTQTREIHSPRDANPQIPGQHGLEPISSDSGQNSREFCPPPSAADQMRSTHLRTSSNR